MNLNWSNRVIKYVLFVFNLLFVISGIIMVAVGVSVKSYFTNYDVFLNDSYFSLANLLIAIGSLIFFISFFGCCGAIRESWFMIFIFSVLLSIIFIMEFSAGIAGYVLRDKTTEYLKTKLLESTADYQFNSNETANSQTIMWDTIQSTFQCCGATGPNDWPKINGKTTLPPTTTTKPTTPNNSPNTSPPTASPTTPTASPTTPSTPPVITTTTDPNSIPPPTNARSGKLRRSLRYVKDVDDLPASCCKSKPGAAGMIECNLNNTQTATYYKEGCVEAFGDYLKEHAVTIGGVGLAIGFIQLFGVIFACHLTRQLKHGFYST